MNNRTVKYLTLTIAVMGMMAIPSLSEARKWSVNFNTKNVNPRIMQKFITRSGNASQARSDGTNFQHNDKIHFYYKVGPLASISGKGAPFRTRLMIKQGSRTLKDFGWQSANAANASQMSKNLTLTWYHSAAWNITLAPNINPGRYSAIVSHQDLNSGKTLNANYSFSVKAASGGASQGSGGYSIDDFIASAHRRDVNRCISYIENNFDFQGGPSRNDVIRDLRSYITTSRNLKFQRSQKSVIICDKNMTLDFGPSGKISGGGVIFCPPGSY
ncbi:MAG TPA: hypothetical protein PKX12_17290 [Spirochaetota bacterium]|nr:hypothetical protein [Spirochaetota bacterium]